MCFFWRKGRKKGLNYYPFGLEQNDRSYQSNSYRYGFNGKEKDNNGEWGSQTVYDYGFRIYNPSIARFLSVDPLTRSYPMLTPYQFASNGPIEHIDVDGQEGLPGAIIAAGIDLFGQVTLNLVKGKSLKQSFREVDYYDVGQSALEGFLSPGGTAKAIAKTGTKLVMRGAREIISESIKASIDITTETVDVIGQEGSNKTIKSVLVEGVINAGVNKTLERGIDPFSKALSDKVKVKIKGAEKGLRTAENAMEKVNKKNTFRVAQKQRRIDAAQAKLDKANNRLNYTEDFTPVIESFGNVVEEITDEVFVKPIEEKRRINKTIIRSKDRVIIRSADGTERVFKKNEDSGKFILKKG